jgi:lantibiotic modifying enzyme
MRKNFNFASFAHGYSGVLTSVMCMHKTKKTIKTKSLISELVKAEETLHVNNFLWKDMRSKDQKYSHYWCHGSLGIMYSRLIWKNLNLTDELNIGESNFTMILEQYKKQITSGVLDSQNYSLCHGNFAFVDFLISYMKIFGYDQKISDYISKIKNKGEKYGYSCIGAPGAINSIGYMVGEAGIQYLLNRIENLNNPSILSIETI